MAETGRRWSIIHPEMRTLLVSLSEHPLAMLRGIAELRGVELASNARDEAAAQLAAVLGEEAATAAAVQALSGKAQAAWTALRQAGGRMKTAAFAREHGEIRAVGPGRLEREATWRQPANAAEELWYRGLIFRTFADFGDGPMEYLYIPEDLPLPPHASGAPAQAARPRGAPLKPVAPPRRGRHALNSLAVDACTLLSALREEPLALDERGRPDPDLAAQLRTTLLLPGVIRFDLLLTLAQANGWLATDRGRLVLDNQRTGAWLRLTHWEQMSQLYSTWRDGTTWNDLRRTPGLLAEGEWYNDAPLARRRLLQLLARLDARSWYALSDLVDLMKQADPDFQRPDGNYTGWYLKEAGSGRYLSGFENWDAVEGRLLHFLIEGPLFWLGAVALDGEGHDGERGRATGQGVEHRVQAFRLTPAGAAWLASRMPQAPPRPARLSIADDFTVTAPLLLPLLDRYRLSRFADPTGEPGWELRHDTLTPAATRHRITRSSLARARASGLKGQDAVSFLKRAAGGRVPARVAAAIQRYDRLGGQVRLTRGAVLRVADAGILTALRADPLIAPLLGDLISAQAVLVPERHLDRLIAILRDSSYTVELL